MVSSLLERRGPRRLAVGAAWLTALVAAGVAVGALGGGDLFGGDDEPAAPRAQGPPRTEAILARGSAPVGGPWEIQSYRSQRLVDEGRVLQRAGLLCIRLMLSNPPPRAPVVGNGQCGVPGRGNFDVMNVPVKSPAGRVEVILFGVAPEGARGVELRSSGGKRVRARRIEAPGSFPGDLWVMPVPHDLGRPRVGWLRPDGKLGAAPRDVTAHLRRGQILDSAPPGAGG